METDKTKMFITKPVNEWGQSSKNKATPRMLFSEFWFEGELCILFADTNLGKSILSVQIGDSISRGAAIPGFKMEVSKQPVLYFDFELSDKQFHVRYSIDNSDYYLFDDNFYRAEVNYDVELGGLTFESQIISAIKEAVELTGCKIIIIDNITYLNYSNENAKDALPLMKKLKALKSLCGLSLLLIAHVPKKYEQKPITSNDVSGSKMLVNFCDSAFSIGKSMVTDSSRYIIQIKQRNTAVLYGGNNVCHCKISKPFNFLQFEFIDFGSERDHILGEERNNTLEFISLFINEEKYQKSRIHKMLAKDLYTHYQEYCNLKELVICSDRCFNKVLKSMGYIFTPRQGAGFKVYIERMNTKNESFNMFDLSNAEEVNIDS